MSHLGVNNFSMALNRVHNPRFLQCLVSKIIINQYYHQSSRLLVNISLICAAPYTKKEGLFHWILWRAPTLQRETLCSQNLGVFPGCRWLPIPIYFHLVRGRGKRGTTSLWRGAAPFNTKGVAPPDFAQRKILSDRQQFMELKTQKRGLGTKNPRPLIVLGIVTFQTGHFLA